MEPNQEKNDDDSAGSALSTGLHWANQVISISLEFVIFLVIGYYLDRYFSTSPWLLFTFAAMGMAEMLHRLLQIAHKLGEKEAKDKEKR